MVIVLAIEPVVIKGAHGPYVSLLNSQVEQHSKLLFFSILCVPLHSLPTFHSLLHPKRHYHVPSPIMPVSYQSTVSFISELPPMQEYPERYGVQFSHLWRTEADSLLLC